VERKLLLGPSGERNVNYNLKSNANNPTPSKYEPEKKERTVKKKEVEASRRKIRKLR